MKKISLTMAILFVLLLAAGCGKTAVQTPTEATKEAETAPTVSAEKAGFTFEDVVHSNDVKTLVNTYGGVLAARSENGKPLSETYYFMYAGKIVSTSCATDAKGEKSYSCTVDNESYTKVGDHLQLSFDPDAQAKEDETYLFGDNVTAQMLDGTIERFEEPDKDTWLFEVHSEKAKGVSCRCTVTKEKLILKTIEWDNGDGTTATVEISHGADVQTKEFGMLDGFAKPLRTVTFVRTTQDKQGKDVEKTYKVEVPYNVEPTWDGKTAVTAYLDKEHTKAYKYPGNGEEGYTVYVVDKKA